MTFYCKIFILITKGKYMANNAIVKNKKKKKEKEKEGLTGVAQWIECWPANRKGLHFNSQPGQKILFIYF